MAYFVMSSVISPLGIVSAPIAAHYDISITSATADFTYLTVGLLLGTAISFFIFDLARLKTIIVGFVFGRRFIPGKRAWDKPL